MRLLDHAAYSRNRLNADDVIDSKSLERALAFAIALFIASPSGAEPRTYALPEETATLRPGPNSEAAQNNCLACHSVDYILLQPPHMGRAYWEGVVKKMIKTYRAKIDADDAQKIVDYLATTY